MKRTKVVVLVMALLPGSAAMAGTATPASAQEREPARAAPARAAADTAAEVEALAAWLALDAPAAHESLATDRLLAALPGWRRDASGNLFLRLGEGLPLRVLACGLDRAGYVVSQVTAKGYLRLHRAGRAPDHPLWDQFHEGQQVTVFTAAGPVPGVTAIANAHFSFQHRRDTAVRVADDLWVDVGARSAAEARALGIRLLDPVARRMPAWTYGGHVAGPEAGARIGCAAVAAVGGAALEEGVAPEAGSTVLLMSVQRTFGWVGLGAALARLGPVDALTLLEDGRDASADEEAPTEAFGYLAPVLEAAGLETVRRLAPAARFPGSLVESVSAEEARRLRAAAFRAAGLPDPSFAEAHGWPGPPSAGASGPAAAGAPAAAAAGGERAARRERAARLLARLADLHGVSGHEGAVRAAVLEALPGWARERAEVDSAGNVVVAVGPDRDTTVFVAHLDEVGFETREIAPDGTVTLVSRGGTIPSAWEGQPALLHLADGPLPGVFVPRREAERRRPRGVTAWFGLDSAGLAERGVRPGLAVTAHKEAVRLGASRFTARGLDDRAGTTALLLALERLGPDPEALPGRVLFAWSVEEETGLHGARALARRLGPSVRRVYSVDTFVSSDTPLESPHFAHAPLGAGPVLRAVESSSITPPEGRRRVREAAARAGLPLQTGITQGGTDGTAFTFWGAPNAGLSWPGRYSHSPVEVLDLDDLVALVDLVVAVAGAPGAGR